MQPPSPAAFASVIIVQIPHHHTSLHGGGTRAKRDGDVGVLYGRFAVVLESEGKQRTFAGRLTEVFVQRDGQWWHPGWHLDLAASPETPATP